MVRWVEYCRIFPGECHLTMTYCPMKDYSTGDYPVEDHPMADHPMKDYQMGDYPMEDYPMGYPPLEDHPTGDYPIKDCPMANCCMAHYPGTGYNGKCICWVRRACGLTHVNTTGPLLPARD